eukprot:scaffold153103_cov26-Tisochrysis_lutea.AAC.1
MREPQRAARRVMARTCPATSLLYSPAKASRRTALDPVAISAWRARTRVVRGALSGDSLAPDVKATSTSTHPSPSDRALSGGTRLATPRRCGTRPCESARALFEPAFIRMESMSSRTCRQMAASPMPIERSTETSSLSEASRNALEKRPVGPVNWNCVRGVASTSIAEWPSADARTAAVTPTGPPPRMTCAGVEMPALSADVPRSAPTPGTLIFLTLPSPSPSASLAP